MPIRTLVRAGDRMASLVARLAVTGLFVAAVAVPSGAAARIAPAKGIAGISIGERMGQVRRHLGRPRRVRPPSWVYGASLKGRVGFDDRGRVNFVWTASRRQRTRKGVGPGVGLRRMKGAYPHARCYAKAGRWRALCVLVSRRHGKTVKADFLFRRVLRRVEVYLVPPTVSPTPARANAL